MMKPLLVLVLVTTLAACATTRQAPKSPILPSAYPSEASPAVSEQKQDEQSSAELNHPDVDSIDSPRSKGAPRSNGSPRSVDVPAMNPSGKDSRFLPGQGEKSGASGTPHDKNMQVEVENMPLSEFIYLVFGKILKVDYYVDKSIQDRKETVTLNMGTPTSPSELLGIVTEVLKGYGLGIQKKGNVHFVGGGPPQQQKQQIPYFVGVVPDDVAPTETVALFMPIYYLTTEQYAPILRTLALAPEGQVLTIAQSNLLYLIDKAVNIRMAQELLRMLDRPAMGDRKLKLFYLTYLPIDRFQEHLANVLPAQGIPVSEKPGAVGMNLIPIPEIGALLAISPKQEWLNFVGYWQEKMDKPEVLGDHPRLFIYRPKNRRATDLAKMFSSAFSGSTTSGATSKTSKSSSNGSFSTSKSSMDYAANPKSEMTTASQDQSKADYNVGVGTKSKWKTDEPGSSRSSASLFAESVMVDEDSNTIIVSATPSKYEMIRQVLVELDHLPRQVLVEVTIAEVTLSDSLQYGIEWAFSHDGSLNQTIKTLGGLGIGNSGMLYSLITDDKKFQAVLNAFAQKNLINILSTPRIMVLDNQEASINVGTEVPVVTSETSAPDIPSSTTPSVLRSIQYRNTGVLLNIKPTINSNGMLTVELSQEVSEAQTNNISPDLSSPLILNRSLRTKVALKSGSTVLLGGLIKSNKSDTKTQVPLLGDIPLLGNAFKTTSKKLDRTELLVQITPHILTSVDDAEALTQKFKSINELLKH